MSSAGSVISITILPPLPTFLTQNLISQGELADCRSRVYLDIETKSHELESKKQSLEKGLKSAGIELAAKKEAVKEKQNAGIAEQEEIVRKLREQLAREEVWNRFFRFLNVMLDVLDSVL
jgi:hypothetical protein